MTAKGEWQKTSQVVVAKSKAITQFQKMQWTVLWFVFSTYAATVMATLAMFFLLGFGKMTLSDSVQAWLGPAILGEAVSSAVLIVAYLFKRDREA